MQLRINSLIRRYGRPFTPPVGTNPDSWLRRPEIPTPAEVWQACPTGEEDDVEEAIPVPINNIDRSWGATDEYLRTHYELLREDSIALLRESIKELQESPAMWDSDETCIYEQVQ